MLCQEEVLTNVLRRMVPIVCIDRRPKINSNVAFIESNHYEGGRLATGELIRIPFISSMEVFLIHSSNRSSNWAMMTGRPLRVDSQP